ncbi:MAG: S8 family serine peptidase [Micromonosporaceae bacterium]|nr:S8 family serine peptidase [Micromonosporaceae bacterium]
MLHRRDSRDRHRRWLAGLAATILAAGLAAAAPPASAQPPATGDRTVEPQLLDQLATGQSATFWVYLRGQADLAAAARMPDRSAQGSWVYEQLTGTARASQSELVSMLDAAHAEYQPYWIANAVQVRGDRQLLDRIAALPEVAQVTGDRVYRLPEPTPAAEQPRIDAVEWNVDRIGAPQVWTTFGTTGQDIVVGSIDSGAQFDHPALVAQYRGNLGNGEFDHDYNWYDPSSVCGFPSLVPCDNNGHGTHTIGTMVGDDGAGNQIGVAPGATWIAAKGCESLSCSQAALLASGQFMLAPTDLAGENANPDRRPHVLNNSWGGGATADPWYQPTVQAWVAAGIFPQFANGNTTTGVAPCGSSSDPGNLPESYAAGAFDINGNIAAFSNRGPSAFGAEIIKPDLSAPGVAVRSSVPGNGFGANSGTSMASPHVAGTVALMWSAAPELERDIVATRELLDLTAVDVSDLTCGGTPGDNNVWGQGQLDAFAAVEQSPRGPTGRLTGTVTDAGTGDPIAGATVSVTGAVERRRTIGPDGGYSFTLPVGEYQVSAAAFGYRPQQDQVSIAEGTTTERHFPLAAPDGPQLSVSPNPLDFGEVAALSASEPASLTLTNTGGEPLTVSDVSVPDSGFEPAGGGCGAAPFTLARLEHCTLDYRFTPSLQGPAEATVRLVSNGPNRASTVTLLGTGTTPVGAQLWLSRYTGTGTDSDVPHDLVLSPDGGTAYLTGRNGGDGTLTDYVTVAYDTATGDQRWLARFDGPASKTDEAWAIGLSPDGSRVFVTGNSATGSFSSDADYATVAYDAATGDQLWVARFDGPGENQDGARALGVSPDGGTVFVTGASRFTSSIFGTDYTTIAYDAATGEQRWLARYDGPGSTLDSAEALGVSPDGGTVFVTGASQLGGSFTEDYATVAYDAVTGAQRWAARYDGPAAGVDRAEALGVSPDGSRVLVTGGSAGVDTGADYATISYDPATGDQQWVARYDGLPGGSDAASAVSVSPDGAGVVVTGGSSGDYGTVAYDVATGAQRWAARYDGPVGGPDVAAAIGTSPDGSEVFVTGNSVGVSFDFATLAYDAATGEQHWQARYNGPVNDGDAGTALAVSPDGSRVLVTGQSVGEGSGADYLTLAHRAALPEIVLAAEARRVRGSHTVDLAWRDATAPQVDIHRDGDLLTTVPNTGSHTDLVFGRGPGSYTYRVCDAGTSHCSDPETVWFGGAMGSLSLE